MLQFFPNEMNEFRDTFVYKVNKSTNRKHQTKKRLRAKTRANAQTAAPVYFEQIEPRVLLSASPIINVDGAGGAPVLIDFNSEPTTPSGSPVTSLTIGDATFTASGGGGQLRITTPLPNGTNGLFDFNTPRSEIRADFANGASEVSVDLGDFGVDNDRIFLEAFDASDNSLGFVDQVIFGGMHTLTLNSSNLTSTNISYIVAGARDADNGSSVFFDNLQYTPAGSADVEVNEGDAANATGTFSDPDVGDIVTLSASVGMVMDTGGGTWAWSYDTGDGPADSQTVTITATDNNGDFSDVSFDITVLNVAPTIGTDNALVTVDEGDTANNTGSLSDPGNDIDTLVASIGNVVDNGNGTYSWSYDTNDGPDDSQTVTITATDVDGESAQIMFDLVVSNLPPEVAADQATVIVDEGDVATNSGTYSDAGNDTVSLSASVGMLIDNSDGTWSWSQSTTDGPDDSITVTVTATDSDGVQSEVMFDVDVNNLPPNVAADQATVTVDEGDTANNTGTYSDGGDDVVTISASIGTIIDNGNGTYSWSFDTADGPDDSQTVTITAIDSDGDQTDVTFGLVVNNLPPSVGSDQATVSVDEGDTANNTGTYSDAGDDIVSLSASIGAIVDNGNGTYSWSFDTTDGPSESQTVTITATDSDGDASQTTFDLAVDNVIPTINSLISSAPMANKSLDGNVTISGTYSDPGTGDTHTVTVDWGDGSGTESISVDQLADTFTGNHSYTSGGIFEITVTVDDGDATVVATTEAVVVGVGLNGGILQVIGSDGDEKIDIKSKNGGTVIEVKVKENGVGTTFLGEFDASLVNGIFVTGMGGDDMITVQHAIAIDAVLNGDDGDDMIFGGSGNDTINGGDGNDKLFGRDGIDDVSGGDGDDMIFGNSDGDSLYGGAGADKIWGALGADTIFGGDGDDMLFGGAGDDLINGDAGNDFISGGTGNDIINGGDGNDLIMGDAGNDILGGDAGDDIIFGGPGTDSLDGGDGLDLLLDGWSWVWE